MTEPSNKARASWAASALQRFADEVNSDEDDQTLLGDLLCNLMHLADRSFLDFRAALAAGESHHAAEVAEEATDRPQPFSRLVLDPYEEGPWPNSVPELLELHRAIKMMQRLGQTMRNRLGDKDGHSLVLFGTAVILAEMYEQNSTQEERAIVKAAFDYDDAVIAYPMGVGLPNAKRRTL